MSKSKSKIAIDAARRDDLVLHEGRRQRVQVTRLGTDGRRYARMDGSERWVPADELMVIERGDAPRRRAASARRQPRRYAIHLRVEALDAWCQGRGWTHERLADEVGVASSTLYRIRSGATLPSAGFIATALALGWTFEELFSLVPLNAADASQGARAEAVA